MTATQPRSKKVQQGAARRRHPTARSTPDGRGPAARSVAAPRSFLPCSAPRRFTSLGAVMVLSASAASSIAETESAWSLFQRQLMWVRSGRS